MWLLSGDGPSTVRRREEGQVPEHNDRSKDLLHQTRSKVKVCIGTTDAIQNIQAALKSSEDGAEDPQALKKKPPPGANGPVDYLK